MNASYPPKWERVNWNMDKKPFYSRYQSIHLHHEKGEISKDVLDTQQSIYKKRFGSFLPEDKTERILDVGCGFGSLVYSLNQMGYVNTIGFDISYEQIDVADSLDIQNVYQADLWEELPPFHKEFGLVFLRDVIEHFTNEEIIKILSLCWRILKEGGKLVIQVPNAESPFFGRIRYGDFTHETAFTERSLTQILAMIGFSQIELQSVEPFRFSLKSTIRTVLWKILQSLYRLALDIELGRKKRIVTQNILAIGVKK